MSGKSENSTCAKEWIINQTKLFHFKYFKVFIYVMFGFLNLFYFRTEKSEKSWLENSFVFLFATQIHTMELQKANLTIENSLRNSSYHFFQFKCH